MSTRAPNPLIDSYIKRLRASARTLPPGRRDELMQQIQDHLGEALDPGSTEVEVRNALDRLGEPEAIVAEEFDRLGIQPARAGKLEWAVIVLLPFGALLIPILGWVLGVILLWASRVWSPGEKLMGTLLVPGGLSAVFFLALIGSGSTCTESSGAGRPSIQHCNSPTVTNAIGIPLLIAFVVIGIATPIFLARRANASRP